VPTEVDRRALPALLADLGCVVGFAALGRRNHDEPLTAIGVLDTAWPFLVGIIVGWLLCRGWRRPAAVVPTGLTVWVCAVVVGMLVRRGTAEGTALAFVVVATLSIGLLVLGWRLVLAVLRRRAG